MNLIIEVLNGEKMEKLFDGKKTTKLGTEKNPANVNVQTKERVKELEAVFAENGWNYKIELEPEKPEDITDLEILLNPQKTRIAEEKVGRNEPCPCGSGKKYKKCCGN
jgi:SWIM/SEC-C metal-binding protein